MEKYEKINKKTFEETNPKKKRSSSGKPAIGVEYAPITFTVKGSKL